ncbi:MAG TPA: lipid-A-disaccharide synthase [Blastocatellia bacterium]|nr:lipid-A-disaccharide synthase [Blastocatellia bacterium]
MIVAGEASGDKHGASLARALKRLYPEIRFDLFGSGGEEMRAAGVETLVDAREVAIIGVPEIARALGKLYRAYRTLIKAARSRRPSAIVLIDWPDFNMRLAKKLHRAGFKIVYYVSPQVWAWRKYRVKALRRDVDRMLVILPFEEAFYERAGIAVEYVGHPLAEAVRATLSRDEFCHHHGLDPARPIFALLPGSRQKEIHYHLPLMLDAAKRLRIEELRIADCGLRNQEPARAQLNPQSAIHNPQFFDPQFIIPLASTVRREEVEAITGQAREGRAKQASGDAAEIDVAIVEGDTYNALCYSEIAVVASGTATVEAALAGTPMVIIYRGSEINWRLIRPLIHLDTFGMVNLIAGRRIVPELIQHDANGERIASEIQSIVSDPARLSRMREDLGAVRQVLTAREGSAAERAARSVIEIARVR